jgi:hypothetical protein
MRARAFFPGQFCRAFEGFFRVRRVRGLGVLLYPGLLHWYRRHPLLFDWAKKAEPVFERTLKFLGNDFLAC